MRLLGVVCSTWMALTLPALAAGPGDTAPASSRRNLWACNESAGLVEFRAGSARLSPEAKTTLGQIVIWASDDPTRSVRLRGMTDRSGNVRANAKLSERRAKAVKSYLKRRGVDPMRVSTVGHKHDETKDDVDNQRAVGIVTCRVTPMNPLMAGPAGPMLVVEPTPPIAELPPPPAPVAAPAPVGPIDLPATMPASPPVQTPRGRSGIGIGAMVGGGLTGFVDKDARAFIGTGPSWDARITVGTRRPVAFEGAYTGSAQNISALGITSNALIVGNGAEAALRLNLTRVALQPYLFGGLGWTRYQLRRTPENSSSLRGSDDILTVPFGAGLAARVARGLLFDLRATGRAALYDNLMDGVYADTAENARLHSWNVGGRLGWEF